MDPVTVCKRHRAVAAGMEIFGAGLLWQDVREPCNLSHH